MSLVREQVKFLSDIKELLSFAEKEGFAVTGGELERKPEIQQIYLREGRAKTMDSMHLRKCAMDLNFFKDLGSALVWVYSASELESLGTCWESLDARNHWGGRDASHLDTSHFERTLGAWPTSFASNLGHTSEDLEVVAVSSDDRPASVIQTVDSSESQTLRAGAKNQVLILNLQGKLRKLDLIKDASGEFDNNTEAAVIQFQQSRGLIVDGVVGPKTWNTLDAEISGSGAAANTVWLGDADIEDVARQLDLAPEILKAVYKVESNGRGFVDGSPKILFEGHVFWARLKKHGVDPQRLVSGNRDILYPQWTREHYGNAAQERNRLARARMIHREAAAESASWGLFQIMGYHWEDIGYTSVDQYVEFMGLHEREHLKAFSKFIQFKKFQKKPLVQLLRDLNWSDFAYAYNGSGYRANAYDDKLAAAYNKLKV